MDLKRKIKTYRNSKNPAVKFTISVLTKLWRAARIIKNLCADANSRSIFLLQLLNGENVHQTTSLTYFDRYLELFAACRDYFDNKKNLKILSYGCSTGEEVLTLRHYFPDAQIVGAEINPHSLTICRNLLTDEKITFVHSELNEIKKHGNFDAIFCLAVLQRTPHLIETDKIRSLKKIYPFEKFARQIIELDELLKPQGLFVIKFTQYLFSDTPIASKYQPLGECQDDAREFAVFDKNSHLIEPPPLLDTIFMKV